MEIEKSIGSLLLAILFATMITNALLRYVFDSGLNWSDELNGFLFVWFSFLSASYVMGKNGHISITAFVDLLPKVGKYIVRQIMNVIMIYFSALYAFSLERVISRLHVSNVMRLPLNIVYFILPVSFILFVIHIAFNMLSETLELKYGKEVEVK